MDTEFQKHRVRMLIVELEKSMDSDNYYAISALKESLGIALQDLKQSYGREDI